MTGAAALIVSVAFAHAQEPAKDFSPAERALFMSDQFTQVQAPQTLRYKFVKSGSLEPGFEDQVSVTLKKSADGSCCAANGEFLSGQRRVPLPAIDAGQGNPVTMYFLERDIREMERLTKGKQNYFRKRIRMAVYQGAALREVSLPFQGKTVAGKQITIEPYLNDPNRPKFPTLANKVYVFTLSDAVPGGVYAIRTLIKDAAKAADAPPLMAEELLLDGAFTTAGKPGS